MSLLSPKERIEKTICATLPSMYAHWARRNQRLLVLNAGLGFHLESLWEAGFDITAHATTSQGLERAQAILGHRAEYMLSQPDSLMCDDNFFDYAFYLGTLENPDPIVTRKTLEELHRVTVSGLVIIFANTFSFLNAGKALGNLMGLINVTSPMNLTKRASQVNQVSQVNQAHQKNSTNLNGQEGGEGQETREDLYPPYNLEDSKYLADQGSVEEHPDNQENPTSPKNLGHQGNPKCQENPMSTGNLKHQSNSIHWGSPIYQGSPENSGSFNKTAPSEKQGKKALYATAYPTCNPFTIRQLVIKEFPKSRFRWFFISTPPQFLRNSPRWRRASHHLLRWCPFNAIYAVRIDFSPQPGTTGLVLRADNIHA